MTMTKKQQTDAIKLIMKITPFTAEMAAKEIVTSGAFNQGTIAQALYLEYERMTNAHNSVMAQLGHCRDQLATSERQRGELVYQMQLMQIELDKLKGSTDEKGEEING